MNHRLLRFIEFLWFAIFSIFMMFTTSKEITKEQHIAYMVEYGVNAQGVLVRELTGTAGSIVFVGKYEAGNLTYEFQIVDNESRLRLGDTVVIKYDSNMPRDCIIKGYNDSNIGNVMTGCAMSLIAIIFTSACLHVVIKIGYLENNGNRVLGEMITYTPAKAPMIRKVKCKIPGDDFKVYKGRCGFRIEKMMEDNNLKYIPIYISQNNKNTYYVHCDELREILTYKRHNGHTIEELQGL